MAVEGTCDTLARAAPTKRRGLAAPREQTSTARASPSWRDPPTSMPLLAPSPAPASQDQRRTESLPDTVFDSATCRKRGWVQTRLGCLSRTSSSGAVRDADFPHSPLHLTLVQVREGRGRPRTAQALLRDPRRRTRACSLHHGHEELQLQLAASGAPLAWRFSTRSAS